MAEEQADVAILGGGLAGGLTALALAARRPDLRVMLVEAGEVIGGNHVWSFFLPDVPPSLRWLVRPLVVGRWDGYRVAFPRHERRLETAYRSITSERLDAVVREALPEGAILTGARVVACDRRGFKLADGREFAAGCVIDARGAREFPGLVGGWQKFVGQMLRLDAPHGLDGPVVMDAAVAQRDGFRFVYVLPFGPDRVFVEDTYYSTSPVVERDRLAAGIAEYAAARGWRVAAVEGEEQGVLPVVAGGDPAALLSQQVGVARIGVAAGLFHPLTGYSLPIAVRVAAMIADLPDMSGEAVAAAVLTRARAHWRDGWYYRMLARMAFGAAAPARRYRVFERFYGLRAGLIERFYAGGSSLADRARILAGRPPVPVGAAVACLLGGGLPLARLDDITPPHPASAGKDWA